MRRLIYIILIFHCTLTIEHCLCQVQLEWQAIYTGPTNNGDALMSMVIDKYGNVYETGYSRGINTYSDYATVKYNTSGVQQWASRYSGGTGSGNSLAQARSVAVDYNGNVYVTGLAPPPGSNSQQKYTTIKYNFSGVQQWVAVYYGGSTSSVSTAYAIATDVYGFVYVTGTCYFQDSGGADFTTIKYDSSGVQQWVSRYHGTHTGGIADQRAYRIVTDYLSNVYITGFSPGDTTYNDIATVKYNSSGIQQWAARYNGEANGRDSATDIKLDSYGNVYVTGTSWGGTSTGYDYVTIKYNESGVQQWVVKYNGTGNGDDVSNSIAVDDFGNIYVTGFTWSGSVQYWNYATIKYNSAGVQQWVGIYDNGSQDFASALTLDNQGNVYVTGKIAPTLRFHFATIKYSPSGVQQWVITTSSQNGETPNAIAVDSIGNIYVAGNNGHYLTIKYSQLLGITPVSNELPDAHQLYQNYPNPFNPSTKIKFNHPRPSEGGEQAVRIIVYDILGREVATLVNENLSPGTYELQFDGSKYPSGVYYYKLIADGFQETKKMILLK